MENINLENLSEKELLEMRNLLGMDGKPLSDEEIQMLEKIYEYAEKHKLNMEWHPGDVPDENIHENTRIK